MVEEPVDLELISIEQLEREHKKIQEARKLAKEAADVKRQLAAGISPLGLGPTDPSGLPRSFFTSDAQTRLGAIRGGRTQNEFNEFVNKQKRIEKELEDVRQKQQQFFENVLGTSLTPQGLIFGLPGIIPTSGLQVPNRLLAILGRFGIIGSIAAGSAGIIMEEVEKQYGPGGVLDTRLKRPEQAGTVNNVDDLNKYRSGTKYITSDLQVAQGAPRSSNTATLKVEHIRYALDGLGK